LCKAAIACYIEERLFWLRFIQRLPTGACVSSNTITCRAGIEQTLTKADLEPESTVSAAMRWSPAVQPLMESIGYILPAEAEANYYRHLASQAILA
jgi:hypothetical protein